MTKKCSYSIFNFVPDIYTEDDHIKVTFEDFETESGSDTVFEDKSNQVKKIWVSFFKTNHDSNQYLGLKTNFRKKKMTAEKH